PRQRPGRVLPTAGSAEPRLQPVSRRSLGPAAGRQHHPAGTPDRLSRLPPRVAESRLAPAETPQLSGRDPRRALRVWRAGDGRARAVPDVARARDGDRDARRPAVVRGYEQTMIDSSQRRDALRAVSFYRLGGQDARGV